MARAGGGRKTGSLRLTLAAAVGLPEPGSVLARHAIGGVTFHGLQTRESGKDRFMSVHVLVPGAWSVQRAHDVVEDVERDLREAVADLEVMSHLEPKEDPRAYGDYSGGIEIAQAMEARDPTQSGGG